MKNKIQAVFTGVLVLFVIFGSWQKGSIQSRSIIREATRSDVLNDYGDVDCELYPEPEYTYNGFLDDVVTDAAWNQAEESYVSLSGTTGPSYESIPFTCSFSFENLVFCFDYTLDDVEDCGEKCINLNNNDFAGFVVGSLIYN